MIGPIMKKEWRTYLATPLAGVFVVVFLLFSGICTFFFGNFFADGYGEASLRSFFIFHPWLYLLLIPALSMRLWAEERAQGSIELLLTLPIKTYQAVLAKFFSTWSLIGIILLLTFPFWFTVNYLGTPDNGVIAASYLGSWVLAGAFLSVGIFVSALTRSHVVAFIFTVLLCCLFVVSDLPVIQSFIIDMTWLSEIMRLLSVWTHYHAITQGLIDVRSVIYFIVFIATWLIASVLIIEIKKAD